MENSLSHVPSWLNEVPRVLLWWETWISEYAYHMIRSTSAWVSRWVITYHASLYHQCCPWDCVGLGHWDPLSSVLSLRLRRTRSLRPLRCRQQVVAVLYIEYQKHIFKTLNFVASKLMSSNYGFNVFVSYISWIISAPSKADLFLTAQTDKNHVTCLYSGRIFYLRIRSCIYSGLCLKHV